MAIQIGYYTPAGNACLGRPGKSALAFMSWGLSALPGARNLGVYNCAVIPGSDQLSVHSVGRALDLGTPKSVPTPASLLLAEQLRLFSHEAGLQGLIHNRKAWWSNHGEAWQTYDGDNPHLDHIHIEIQNKWLDTGINPTWLNEIFFGPAIHPYPARTPVKQGDSNEDVAYVQNRLRAHGMTLAADGVYGPITAAAVIAFQQATRIPAGEGVTATTYGRLG